jgi:signal transduction histidine kinase
LDFINNHLSLQKIRVRDGGLVPRCLPLIDFRRRFFRGDGVLATLKLRRRDSAVLLTRSVRRKLIFGLGLVVSLVALSTLCNTIGINSYRRTVADLELSISKLPRRAELIAAMTQLYAPLSAGISAESAPDEVRLRAAEARREQFRQVFAEVNQSVADFKVSWNELPEVLRHDQSEQVAYYDMLLRAVDNGLREIQSAIPGLGDPDRRHLSVQSIAQSTTHAVDIIKAAPDPSNRLWERLREAKADYRRQLWLTLSLGVVSVLLLIGLIFWGYQLIFVPILQLHKGVQHLTRGDYGYRIRVDTTCEMSELAEAFNDMSRHIQEDRADKERQIEERSKQLVLSERMAGAGFLASGVAHEINNPLSVIMTAAYGLDMLLNDDVLSGLKEADRADVREYLKLIQSESERCERITKKLLDFSHGRGGDRNLYDVKAIVDEVVNMVGHLSRYQDRRITIDSPEALHAWINAPEIKQVILNLLANALDATRSGGQVALSLKEFHDEVEISVQDDGIGMSQEQLRHIFEPFFTTKDVGKGTGLGLSISHRIVQDQGGTLQAASEGPGKGARFSIRLPRLPTQSKAA